MKLRQLHYAHQVAQQGLNVTAAAEALFTSQPGVSKQIALLEEELGVELFQRNGKHFSDTTPAGKKILEHTEKLLMEVRNIQRIASEYRDGDQGELRIATTHTQARYALPKVITAFRKQFPRVRLHLHQGAPPQIAKMAAEGEVDFAIATEAMEHFKELIMLPCYDWNRSILTLPDHPLAVASATSEAPVSLQSLAQHPIVTYTFGFTGRSRLDQAFAAHGLTPEVVLTAVDADVIKTYVRLGVGVGIVASMAYDPAQDSDLVRLDASHLFANSTTHLGFRRGLYLRPYMRAFIESFAPHWNADRLDLATLQPEKHAP